MGEVAQRRESYPAIVKDYGNGLLMIRHANNEFQGRAIFCKGEVSNGEQLLVLLKIYKKESDSVPKRIMRTALDRKKKFEETNGLA